MDQAYNTQFVRLRDMADKVAEEIGLTDWFEITQERIDQFAEATGDPQWIHTDPERAAKESPYGKTIAHGFLVLSLASKFAYEAYQVEDAVMGINYGLDKVRFPNATPVDALLRARVSLMEFGMEDKTARFKLKMVFELQGESKPACVAEFIALAMCK